MHRDWWLRVAMSSNLLRGVVEQTAPSYKSTPTELCKSSYADIKNAHVIEIHGMQRSRHLSRAMRIPRIWKVYSVKRLPRVAKRYTSYR